MQNRPVVVRPSRWASGLMVLLSLGVLLTGIAFPFVVRHQGTGDLLLAILFISLPGVMGGSLAFLQGWLRFRTFLAFDQDGLSMVIPTIRGGGCFFPLRKCRLRWGDLNRITAIECLYSVGILFPVRQYTLHTAYARYTLAPAFCPRLEKVVRTIAERGRGPD
ncbi:MAG: hypothetical protein KatS3mg131_1061 [Candidatus Tectimicrobiota bacterium]|nr:MAG: hypothetical protein KatS3mg131_1061 [Candidatus Tectomicrobia bacterium]